MWQDEVGAFEAAGQSQSSEKSRTQETIEDYDAVAKNFAAFNSAYDVSQNINALLNPLRADTTRGKLTIVDLGCAGGRDMQTFCTLGCECWGVDGSKAFCDIAKATCPSLPVLQQDFCELDLPDETFDGVYSNTSLYHVPLDNLPDVLDRIHRCLKPGGVFFASNAHGNGKDKEGWSHARSSVRRSWVTWLSEKTWNAHVTNAGFELLDSYYRGANRGFLASVRRKVSQGRGTISM